MLLLLALLGCLPPPAIEIDGLGGDAWTFEQAVRGHAEPSCGEVVVESPRGAVRARRDADAFSALVPLVAGENTVRARCGDGVSDPQVWDVRLEDRPRALTRGTPTEDGFLLDGGGSRPSEVRAAPIVEWTWTGDLGTFEGREVLLPTPPDGLHRLDLVVTDADGRTDQAGLLFEVAAGEARAVDPVVTRPAWVDEAVVYGVIPFFFEGGTLDGVTGRLDEIAALGATVLWLSPVQDAPADDFGYAVTDPFTVRERLGGPEAMKRLVEEAHALELKVIVDFVANHTSDEHPYHRHAEAHGAASPYADFYEGTFYFDWENLPNLDYDEPEVKRYVTEALSHWVREYDVDGFRLDAAWGVQWRAPELWPEVVEELQRIEPDLLLLAEASGRDPYWSEHGFDIAYDWAGLGQWAWLPAWEHPERTAELLHEALSVQTGPLFRFLNNNDTGARFVTRYGVERLPSALALLMTVPGVPCVYTGDEVGAAYEPYDEGPPLSWDDPHGLRPLYLELVDLRRTHPALHTPDWTLFEPEGNVLSYLRHSEEENLLVVLNFGDTEAPFPLAGPHTDVLTGEAVEELTLPPYGFRILAQPGGGEPQRLFR